MNSHRLVKRNFKVKVQKAFAAAAYERTVERSCPERSSSK